ncbi:30S ribosomal protein S16 [Puniceicoccus vermicola]|uniref:Small ribosomal subunit protein bS16 n=1 Tax=Puniceicoccus vermicola TaxID=388746 RepID=A0A7X1B231_9BACT|nr:30S ribosomal protein S16 [Puniceicoccus vermicola]MBC2603118.1 30S ribosomal protein S16 [Puniceicoccus vermicola]
MALKIRLQRHGNRHNPFYRVVVAENTARRDGRYVELLGTYDPQNKTEEKQWKLDLDRVDYWQEHGAKPTDTVRSLIRRARKAAPEAAAAPAGEEAPAQES